MNTYLLRKEIPPGWVHVASVEHGRLLERHDWIPRLLCRRSDRRTTIALQPARGLYWAAPPWAFELLELDEALFAAADANELDAWRRVVARALMVQDMSRAVAFVQDAILAFHAGGPRAVSELVEAREVEEPVGAWMADAFSRRGAV